MSIEIYRDINRGIWRWRYIEMSIEMCIYILYRDVYRLPELGICGTSWLGSTGGFGARVSNSS